jgi:putative GTP pyrophosphokinase
MQKADFPDRGALLKRYKQYSEVMVLVTRDIEVCIEELVRSLPSHLTIKGRAKGFESFFKKYVRLFKLNTEGAAPPVITDLIGIRIICPFIEDLSGVEQLIKGHFEVLEVERKGSNYSFKEFGYESTHLLIRIPGSIRDTRGDCGADVAEVQIRTILQDAWAEVEHELVYKAEFTPFDNPMKRKLAAVNASLSLADIIFQEVRSYQRQLNGELGKRRDSFFKKIEESIDTPLLDYEAPDAGEASVQSDSAGSDTTIDDLLLNALYAHNKNQFTKAIEFYSRILELQPDNSIASLIYKHRGMANFAQSQYGDAITDFTQSLELDSTSYKAAYYRGVVQAVLQHYDDAINDFSLSLTINPYQPFCFYRRGQAFYHLEDYSEALADCESALELDPESEPVRKFRQMLLDKLKM